MSRVERLEEAVKALDADELAEFRAWFAEYDWAMWDQQVGCDIRTGRLTDLADEALRDHASVARSLFDASRFSAVVWF